MPREWFELQRGDGRMGYLHSRTGTSLYRQSCMTDSDWAAAREAFFRKYPRASEIRAKGSPSIPTTLIPRGSSPVFSPGDRLSYCLPGCRKLSTARIAGIQMPLFGGDDQPSYLLVNGAEIFWNGGIDRWVLRTDSDKEIAVAARIVPRRKKKSA